MKMVRARLRRGQGPGTEDVWRTLPVPNDNASAEEILAGMGLAPMKMCETISIVDPHGVPLRTFANVLVNKVNR